MKCEICGLKTKNERELLLHQVEYHTTGSKEELCKLKERIKKIPEKRKEIRRVHPVVLFSCLLSSFSMVCIHLFYGKCDFFYISFTWLVISIFVFIINLMIEIEDIFNLLHQKG